MRAPVRGRECARQEPFRCPAPKTITLDHLRRYAVARTLFPPTTLQKAIERLGFVQADPIRAPARAQDLTLRHRVKGYRAGDLERRYPRLDVEEDCLVNYGFVPRSLLPLMHPRAARRAWDAATERRAAEVLDFVRARGRHASARRAGGVRPRPRAELGRHQHAQRQHRAAGRHALPRPAARGAARGGHARLRGRRPRAGGRRARRAPRARAPAADAHRRQVRAAALGVAGLPGAAAAVRRAAPARRDAHAAGRAARQLAAGQDRRRHLAVDAGRGSGVAASGGSTRSARGCWRRSTRWSGIGGASSCCGAGHTSSRPTRPRPSARWATTRCRCCTATRRSAGPTRRWWTRRGWRRTSASPTRHGRAIRPFLAPSTPNLGQMAGFLQLDRGAARRLRRARK